MSYERDSLEWLVELDSKEQSRYLRALEAHPDCRDPEHPGCNRCDEDDVSLGESND